MKCYAWWPPALGKPRRILPEYCSNGSISMPCSDPISSVRNLVSNLLLVTTDVFMVVVQKHHTRFESLAARKKPARGGLWFCSCRQQMDIPDLRRISRLNAALLRRIQRCHREGSLGFGRSPNPAFITRLDRAGGSAMRGSHILSCLSRNNRDTFSGKNESWTIVEVPF